MATFQLDLVTPEKMLFSEEVQQVRAPGVLGSFGILPRHAPLLTELEAGLVRILLSSGSEENIAVSGGFLQVTEDKVVILADAAELSTEIDVARAEATLAKAQEMLSVPGELSADEVRQMMDRARNRLRVSQLGPK